MVESMQTPACCPAVPAVRRAASAGPAAAAAPALECGCDVKRLVHGGRSPEGWGLWLRLTSLSWSGGRRRTRGLGTLGKA